MAHILGQIPEYTHQSIWSNHHIPTGLVKPRARIFVMQQTVFERITHWHFQSAVMRFHWSGHFVSYPVLLKRM